ncbi:hypothetical protein [Halobacillus sp. BBL2006]|uniref:hypothetical protein n=1 Tax=Halobacillus sp. BBL2006 TaxID=1543706 RepID=UPI000543CC2C|nr:hypothetical protein [Halobacillus sp. BBL2006]KHE71929.1 hypothetical protein LD39_07225 [Halobacillus sp. BBL2006]
MFQIVRRKIIASYISSTIPAILFAILLVDYEGYNQGDAFAGWTYTCFLFIGAIVLIYGSLISTGLEYIHCKRIYIPNYIYVFLHGVFGVLGTFFFTISPYLICAGFFIAAFYGIADRYIHNLKEKNRELLFLMSVPLILFGGGLIYFGVASIPEPPFTKEDALESVRDENEAYASFLPEEGVTREKRIGELHIKKKTEIKDLGGEVYVITFKVI